MQRERETDWWDVSDDPDLNSDLGYEAVELDVIRTNADGNERVLVLPTDEEMLAEDAFMIVDESAIHEVGTMR